MSAHFHNTTQERGGELLRFERVTQRQDDLVLAFYRARPGQPLTPSYVWRSGGFEGRDVPLTSVRRAITNLTQAKELVKTTIKRAGVYGRPECCWTYPDGRRATVGGDLLL